jgi:hypothetical protein
MYPQNQKAERITHDPHHLGRLAARKAWTKALLEDTPENILAGLERYLECLPDDPQFIPYPATWLNQGRWMDEEPRKKSAWEKIK